MEPYFLLQQGEDQGDGYEKPNVTCRPAIDVMVDPWAYIWDFAPCKILAEEAGGTFANFTGKKGSITEGTAIVGNSKLVEKVRKLYLAGKKTG